MKTFNIGGIHPAGTKLSGGIAIRRANVPSRAVIPLSQHIGAPAVPLVKRGDRVKVGTKIAEAAGVVSANIHSSVSGTVAKIDMVVGLTGYAGQAIIIDVDGDEWDESIDRTQSLVRECKLTPSEIIDRIREAGVVGLGGACFPTHVKLVPPPGQKADCIIINGVECESYLTSDHRLMIEKTKEIMVGISILMKAVGVDKAYIGIEANKPDAISAMREEAGNWLGIEVVALKTKYPQGGEKQLIDAILGRRVPAPPAIPVNVGVIVQNIATVYAVYEAVQKSKPLIERVVTVTGKSLGSPANLLVRIGTPVARLFEEAGGLPEDTGKVISGGPMMGKALPSLDIPVCKGTSGIVVMSGDEARRTDPEPCIRCAKCVSVCPMGLEPYLLATASSMSCWDKVEDEDIMTCVECGSCQYTCPSHRPLLDYIRNGKRHVGNIIKSRNQKK